MITVNLLRGAARNEEEHRMATESGALVQTLQGIVGTATLRTWREHLTTVLLKYSNLPESVLFAEQF